MRFIVAALLALLSTSHAFSLNAALSDSMDILQRGTDAVTDAVSTVYETIKSTTDSNKCPSVWTSVAKDLKSMYLSNGQCTDDARAAIRLAFHDCASWKKSLGTSLGNGGCDGSIILSGTELSRFENLLLVDISNKLTAIRKKYSSIGMADLIQFSAASAIVLCPGGPRIETTVGRKDSSKASQPDLLPVPSGAGSDAKTIYKLFADKGFSSKELAALVGAHTAARQQQFDPANAGSSQDSTPGRWDVIYYAQTLLKTKPKGVESFTSDVNLATDTSVPVAKEFNNFVGNQAKWSAAFSPA